MLRLSVLLGLLALGPAAPAVAQVRSTLPDSWSPPALAGHIDASPRRAGDPDAALRRARPAALVVGGALGSVLGTFLGVTAGTQAAGARPADLQRRLAGALGGMLAGIVTSAAVAAMAENGDRSLLIPSFAVGQGIFAGIIGTARHASADSTTDVR